MRRTEDDLVRRTRRVVLATVALLTIALLGTVVWWRVRLSHEVNGRLRALQRAGLPASGAELNQWYASVPDSENAALVLTQAFALVTNVAENSISEAKRRHFFISHMLIVSLSRITVREAEGLAEMRIARAALAVERFRLSNDRLPKGLQELVPRFLPAVPLDPFDGTSRRYKPLPKGYVIYSIGLDGRDDSGKEPPVRRRGSERVPEDITFAVER